MQRTERLPVTREIDEVREASRRIVRELGFLQGSFRDGGVSHAECHALIELGKRGGATVGELAEILRLDKSTVSRTVTNLEDKGFATAKVHGGDARRKIVTLSAAGRRRLAKIDEAAAARVAEALETLRREERDAALLGLATYASALERSRVRRDLVVRPITPADDKDVAKLIRSVMPEFGASGEGFAIMDPEVDAMSVAYGRPRHGYFVIERRGRVVGGGGYGPLAGGPRDTCELRKMYFYREIRGLGMGEALIDLVLGHARRARFKRCYLETLGSMKAAQKLYERKGFIKLSGPRGKTGHFGCNTFYERRL